MNRKPGEVELTVNTGIQPNDLSNPYSEDIFSKIVDQLPHELKRLSELGSAYYNEFQIPPDIQLLHEYKVSTNFGLSPHSEREGHNNNKEIEVNRVSKLPIENREFEICSNPSDYVWNGYGYVLFFKMMKFGIIGLISMIPAALFLLIFYNTGNDCGYESGFLDSDFNATRINLTEIKALHPPPSNTTNNSIAGVIDGSTLLIANGLQSVIDPRDIFKSALSYISTNFRVRYFQEICALDVDLIQNEEKVQLCLEYRREGCLHALGNNPNLVLSQEKIDQCIYFSFNEYNSTNPINRCAPNLFNMMTMGNRVEYSDQNTIWDTLMPYMEVFVVFALVCSTCYFQFWHEWYSRKIQGKRATHDDFNVLVEDIPFGEEFEGIQLRKILTEKLESMKTKNSGINYKVRKITFVYNLKEYSEMVEKMKNTFESKVKDLYYKYIESEHSDIESRNDIDTHPLLNDTEHITPEELEEYRHLYGRWSLFEKRYNNDDVSLMVGKAFVAFESAEMAFDLKSRFKRIGVLYNTFDIGNKANEEVHIQVKGKEWRINFDDPQEPHDIKWENLEYTRSQRFVRNLISAAISFSILLIGYFLLFFLRSQQVEII